MNSEIFFALAQSLGRPDLAGPLGLGLVATDLFALALGLKRPSSLFKKLDSNPRNFPPLHYLPGSRRRFFRLDEIEAWNARALTPLPPVAAVNGVVPAARPKRAGRPSKVEQREAERRGITVAELRSQVALGVR